MRSLTLLVALALASLTAGASSATAQDGVPTAEEASALVQGGRFAEAVAAWKKRADDDPEDGRARFMHAYSLHAAGDLDAAHDAHIDAARFPEFTALALYNHACVHALRKERDQAFVALREAMSVGFSDARQLEDDPDWDGLRADGRLDAILLELGGESVTDLAALPAARRFDFYLGSWERRNGDKLERSVDVRSAFEGNGMIVSALDEAGDRTMDTSIFLFDADDDIWRQVWISREGMTVTLEGGYRNGSMVLDQVSQDGKPRTGARAVYTGVTERGFTYQWQSSVDGGRTWETLAARSFARVGTRTGD